MTERSTLPDIREAVAHFLAPHSLPRLGRSRSSAGWPATKSDEVSLVISTPADLSSAGPLSAASFFIEPLPTGSPLSTGSYILTDEEKSTRSISPSTRKIDRRMETTKQPTNSSASKASRLCRDTSKQAEKAQTGLGLRGRLRVLIKNTLPGKEKCTGCDKEIKSGKLIIAPCNHRYCQHCIREMAGVALKNTELFPVRCCSQDIPVKQVVSTLMNAERTTYISRSEEHAVPPSERWYCPQTKCGQWIRPRYLKAGPRGLRCPHCRSFICIKCRDIAHEDRDCETDPMLMEVLNVARHQRWQRCYNCHTMVEKTSGCNHMKCACAAEFCYSCSRRWPCHCRGTTEVVDDAGRLEEDPALDTTMVVAAMEQAERELTEREVADVVTEYEQFEMQRPLSNEAPSQAETRPIWPPGMMWFMEDLAHRIPAGSR